MLTRRGFLGALAAAVVADPERLLWTPGKKKIFIPKIISPPHFGEIFFDPTDFKLHVWMEQARRVEALIPRPFRQLQPVDFRIPINPVPGFNPVRIVSKEELKKIYG